MSDDKKDVESDDTQYCPACGQELPELSDRAACLCPHCGVRCCEGAV